MDPIADMITIIRNGYMARSESVLVRHSRLKEEVARKLEKMGFIGKVKISEDKKSLEIALAYDKNHPKVTGIERVSKPSLRVYRSAAKTPRVLSGLGDVILSTSKGILSGKEARKIKSGGEVLLKVW